MITLSRLLTEPCAVVYSVRFSSRWYLCTRESPYIYMCVHHPIFQKFPQYCLGNRSTVPLIDINPLLFFQGRSSSASSFLASLLQAIDGVMSLALCPQVVSQALEHFKSSEKQATCEGCFACQSVCLVISLHSGMLFIVQVNPTSLKHKAHQIPWTSHRTTTAAIASTCACSAKMQRTSSRGDVWWTMKWTRS